METCHRLSDYHMENWANLWCFVGPILLLPGNLLTLLLRQEGHILHACRGLAATNFTSLKLKLHRLQYSLAAETAMHVQMGRMVSPFFCVKRDVACNIQQSKIRKLQLYEAFGAYDSLCQRCDHAAYLVLEAWSQVFSWWHHRKSI